MNIKYHIGKQLSRFGTFNEFDWVVTGLFLFIWGSCFIISIFVPNPCPFANPYNISGWVPLIVMFLYIRGGGVGGRLGDQICNGWAWVENFLNSCYEEYAQVKKEKEKAISKDDMATYAKVKKELKGL